MDYNTTFIVRELIDAIVALAILGAGFYVMINGGHIYLFAGSVIAAVLCIDNKYNPPENVKTW